MHMRPIGATRTFKSTEAWRYVSMAPMHAFNPSSNTKWLCTCSQQVACA